MVLFTNAEVYEAYYNNYDGLNSEKEKFTFPITVHFLSEDNETILETQTKLYNFPLNYTFVNDWTQNGEYRFPQIDGSETQWFIDGNNNALKETNKLKSSPIQDVFEFVPEVKRVIIPENPTIVPILDGEDLPANQNKLVVGDDRAHSFGIRVDHALLEKPQNPRRTITMPTASAATMRKRNARSCQGSCSGSWRHTRACPCMQRPSFPRAGTTRAAQRRLRRSARTTILPFTTTPTTAPTAARRHSTIPTARGRRRWQRRWPSG